MAVADLADVPEVGLGRTPREAVMEALMSLSDELTAKMAAKAALG